MALASVRRLLSRYAAVEFPHIPLGVAVGHGLSRDQAGAVSPIKPDFHLCVATQRDSF